MFLCWLASSLQKSTCLDGLTFLTRYNWRPFKNSLFSCLLTNSDMISISSLGVHIYGRRAGTVHVHGHTLTTSSDVHVHGHRERARPCTWSQRPGGTWAYFLCPCTWTFRLSVHVHGHRFSCVTPNNTQHIMHYTQQHHDPKC